MTNEEAAAEARRRYGHAGYVALNTPPPGCVSVMPCEIGYSDANDVHVTGYGHSWDAAFAMADGGKPKFRLESVGVTRSGYVVDGLRRVSSREFFAMIGEVVDER